MVCTTAVIREYYHNDYACNMDNAWDRACVEAQSLFAETGVGFDDYGVPKIGGADVEPTLERFNSILSYSHHHWTAANMNEEVDHATYDALWAGSGERDQAPRRGVLARRANICGGDAARRVGRTHTARRGSAVGVDMCPHHAGCGPAPSGAAQYDTHPRRQH